ncbi:MAG: RNA pseudouridine synthase [Bacteroidales bacterium]|nr:RNA pseudouridine synthase [Bacteroidales bacterium]
MPNSPFHPLHCPNISLPAEFTFPFHYIPHPLCLNAAQQVFDYVSNQQDFEHDFGIKHHVEGVNVGKMFGVLVVKNAEGSIGFFAAFSGKLAGTQSLPFFVPPIVNLTHEESFYRKKEQQLNEYNTLISKTENNENYLTLCKNLSKESETMNTELSAMRATLKTEKAKRDAMRAEAQKTLSPQEYAALWETLKRESLQQQYAYKQRRAQWLSKITELQAQVDRYNTHIQQLKTERREKSEALQQEIFSQYTFLNARGERKSLNEIFTGTAPAGAGECAAPKLLNYAYSHGYKPLAMAEFWWGQSPASEVRRHKLFYPACKSKCEPILGFMLQGLQVEKNPLLEELASQKTVKILYDDDDLVIINKPPGMLSVPGNVEAESAYSYLQKLYNGGIFVVHRLDMATSGILIFSKNAHTSRSLQEQFSERRVKKRYIALLQGIITEHEGKIDFPLRPDLDNRPQQILCYDYGKQAITSWKVVERGENTTKIHFYPHTGRTHQLRVHAAHKAGLNAPIVGDDLYGTKADRLYLHAEYIEFEHPISKKRVHFFCKAEF